MSSTRRRALAFLPLALLAASLLGGTTVRADGVTVQMKAALEVGASGDGRARVEIVFGPAVYPGVKERSPDARKFLQGLAPDRADYEMTNASARYDDAKYSVVLEMVERGAAKNRGGGRWELESEPTATLGLVKTTGSSGPTVEFQVKGDWGNGVLYEGQYVVALPKAATEVNFDEGTKVLSWHLDAPASTGPPRLSAELRARDRMMSSIYKVYGLGSDLQAYWLAKTLFRNDGRGVAHNLKVRYRLQGYGDWSPWEKHAEVVPGQSVISVLYPVLEASIAKLKTNTPANVLLEYSYEDDAGKKFEDDAAKKIVILGVNEFVFGNLTAGASFGTWQEDYNNAPLLAAWVSRNDAVIKQFAAMANRLAGGVGASTDDASAMRVLRACYQLLQANDFTYQHPPALEDKTVSFDPKNVQNVKFPRETIRDRSGTCIDLAILYASMVNAIGLEPHLALIPGHCFPLIKLPSGRVVGVETTGIQGGLRTGSAPFERAQPYADEEYAKAQQDGRIYEIDVRSLWTRGISNPEMEEAPADILERWGISEEGRAGRTPAPDAPAPSASGPDAVLGVWGGAIGSKMEGGTLDAFLIGIDKADGGGYTAASRADLTLTADGKSRTVVIITHYAGKAQGDVVVFESTERKRTIDGGEAVLLPQAFMKTLVKNGRMEARVGNDDEGYTDFTLSPKASDGPPAPGPADAVRGSWGGEMPHAKLSENVILDELYVDVPVGAPWTASVRMEFTVLSGADKVPVTVLAEYANGRLDGENVRFDKVAWRRTVKATGKQDDLDGNPLVLHVTSEGKLAGTFEGGDGWPFTILRRDGAPSAPTPPTPPTLPSLPMPAARPANLDAAAGKWGGDLHLKIDDGTVESLFIAINKTGEGAFVAGSRGVYTVVDAAKQTVRIVIVGRYEGKVEGDKIVLRSTSRKAGPEGKPLVDIEPGIIEVTSADGRIQGRMGNDKGWMTFALPPRKD